MDLDKFVDIKKPQIDLPNGFTYIENFIEKEESLKLFEELKGSIEFEEREITIYGKTYLQPRLIKWFGDREYTYSKQTFKQESMPKIINQLKEKIEKETEKEFNSVLINYYRNEKDSMGKHSDDEKELGINPTICSLSLGEIRDFVIINKETKERIKIPLSSGSLLIMGEDSQEKYYHELPKSSKRKSGRINLTFRKII